MIQVHANVPNAHHIVIAEDPPLTLHLRVSGNFLCNRRTHEGKRGQGTRKTLLASHQILPQRGLTERIQAQTRSLQTADLPAYGEQGPAKLSRHKAAKPLNLDHAAKPRSHKATWRHSLTGASQRHKAAKLQKKQNVVELESRDTLACMASHEPRLWRFETL